MMLAIGLVTLSSAAWAQSNPTLTEAERGIRHNDKSATHLRIDVGSGR